VRREIRKFLSGVFAGFAIEHAVIAVYIAQGVFNEPRLIGREWGAVWGWLGAALCLIVSVCLGYFGWRRTAPGSLTS